MYQTKHKLANGTIRWYYYDKRGGTLFYTSDGKPATKVALAAAKKQVRPEPVDKKTVDSLIDRFKRSAEFKSLSLRSERNYSSSLRVISKQFGKFPYSHFTKPQARGVVKRWHQKFSDTPRMADEHLKVLVRLLNFAIDEGLIMHHCANRMKKMDQGNRSEIIWTDDELFHLYSSCSTPELEMTIKLAVATGLRREALTRLPVSSVKGNWIEWVYGTGKKRIDVVIPVTDEIRAILSWFNQHRGAITTVCFSSRGRPWTADGLSTSFMKAREKAGQVKRFHDFRGTAATRFASQGFSDAEIASFLGWSPSAVEKIITRYVRRQEVVKQNIIRMNKK